MKKPFVASVVISATIGFTSVYAYRKLVEQKQFEAKMTAVDNWLNRSK